jgi:hypothetical protein
MVEQGSGRIIFVSSESGLNIPAELVHYGWLAFSRGIAVPERHRRVMLGALTDRQCRRKCLVEDVKRRVTLSSSPTSD